MGRGLLLLGVGLLLQLTSAKVGREGMTRLVSQNNLHGEQVARLVGRVEEKVTNMDIRQRLRREERQRD